MSTPQGDIVGNYRLIERIGRGGMGVVYRGQHLRLGSDAAVKVLAASLAEEADFVQRFRREAVSAAALDHPSIVRVWDYGEQDGLAYLIMPLLTGGSLESRLRKGPLSLDQALDYLRAIADALDYAHSKGLVHRDLKPANILLDERGEAHLADFGIAQVVGSEERLTRTGVGIGTPEYMAPEQLQGRAERRSDLYALGVVLYQMLSGQVPYSGSTPYEVITKHLTAVLPPVRRFNPALPPAVDEVLARVLAKSPEDRYESGAAFFAAFARAIGAASAQADSVPCPDSQPTAVAVPTPPAALRTVPVLTPPGGATAGQVSPRARPAPSNSPLPRGVRLSGRHVGHCPPGRWRRFPWPPPSSSSV
ncbi:MAG: protein kinase [Chloroflexia bacterium]